MPDRGSVTIELNLSDKTEQERKELIDEASDVFERLQDAEIRYWKEKAKEYDIPVEFAVTICYLETRSWSSEADRIELIKRYKEGKLSQDDIQLIFLGEYSF